MIKKFNTIKEDKIKNGETKVSSTIYFENFRKFGDLLFYSTLIMGDGAEAQKVNVTKLLINQK